MVVMDAVPEVLMQLPACLGTLASLADEHSRQFARAAGVSAGGHLPGGLGPAAALGLVAAVAWAVPALSARVEDDESVRFRCAQGSCAVATSGSLRCVHGRHRKPGRTAWRVLSALPLIALLEMQHARRCSHDFRRSATAQSLPS